jgi:hypothetical protein
MSCGTDGVFYNAKINSTCQQVSQDTDSWPSPINGNYRVIIRFEQDPACTNAGANVTLFDGSFNQLQFTTWTYSNGDNTIAYDINYDGITNGDLKVRVITEGIVSVSYKIECTATSPPDPPVIDCCDWFANSNEFCVEWGGTGTTDLIAPSPSYGEYEDCRPEGCNCIPVFINTLDPTNTYENDFSSFLYAFEETPIFTLQEYIGGVWTDVVDTPWTVFPLGTFEAYPNRVGIRIDWVQLAREGTFRLKVGTIEPLYTLPHCVDTFDCDLAAKTVRVTGKWGKTYTNVDFKGGLGQYIELDQMPYLWEYQIRYYGSFSGMEFNEVDSEVISYYDDFNNLHYQKMQESVTLDIMRSRLDLIRRHIYYVARGNEVYLEDYSKYTLDNRYLKSYPVVFDSVSGLEYGQNNRLVPKTSVKYRKRWDKMLFSV